MKVHLALPFASLVAALLSTGSPASAQSSLAGSRERISASTHVLAGGGRASSAYFRAELALGGVGLGQRASSAAYSAVGGAVATPAVPANGPPVVFGLSPRSGSKDGGQPATLLGFRLDGGAVAAFIGGTAATVDGPSTGTALPLVVPPGVDAQGNPLAAAEVSVVTSTGDASAQAGYVYGPGLVSNAPARQGGAVDVTLFTEPLAKSFLVIGGSDGGWTSVSGAEGAFGLSAWTVVLAKGELAIGGERRWTFPLPDDPGIAGQSFLYQGLAVVPGNWAFTNVLEVDVLP